MSFTIFGIDVAELVVSNFQPFVPANYRKLDTNVTRNQKTGLADVETFYNRIDGDASYPVSMRSGLYPKAQADGTVSYNFSDKYTFYAQRTEGEVVEVKPIVMTLSWNSPWAPVVDPDLMMAGILNLASFAITNITDGELTSEQLELLSHGVTEIDLSNVVRTTA